MKAKKALKRLNKVETLLSNVIDQFAQSGRDLRELLDNAKASVVRAKKTVEVKASRAVKKPLVKAQTSKSRLSAEGRRKLSLAAKKRWAAAKRTGISPFTGRPLSKTA